MLSGDDMTCYLLFPEVSFHCIDKWRKQDHEEVQMILTVWAQIFSNFWTISLLFLCLFFSFSFFLFFWGGGFVLVEFVWNSDWWQKLWRLIWTQLTLNHVSSAQSQCSDKEKSSPGSPPAGAYSRYLKCPHMRTAWGGSCQGLHHSTIHMLHK